MSSSTKRSGLRKYFWEGQHLKEEIHDQNEDEADPLTKFYRRNRKWIAFLTPFCIVQAFWWSTAFRFNWFSLFPSRWQMALVMFFGSTVAGMTSEGGGAVAFPVMTLLLKIDPSVARDFSLICQSFGMTSALVAILIMNINIEKSAVILGTLGSIPGFILGSLFLDPYLSPPQKKMLFVSVWSSFAIALYMLNSQHKRTTYDRIQNLCAWKMMVLVITGMVGGIFTSFAGSGVDICVFSVITLLFRVSEKTATPTSVVLMGINTVVGVYWRAIWEGDVSQLAWEYAAVAVPVASTMAPLGSFVGSHVHRQVLAWLIYILEGLAAVGFLITRPPMILVGIGFAIILVAFVFFSLISKVGEWLLKQNEEMKTDANQNLVKV